MRTTIRRRLLVAVTGAASVAALALTISPAYSATASRTIVTPPTSASPSLLSLAPTGALTPAAFATPALPLGAPSFPTSAMFKAQLRAANRTTLHTEYLCYPAGTDAYDPTCIGGTEGYAHWGNEPYFNTHRRYIWLVDELPAGSRQSAWLKYTVAALNSVAKSNNPLFIYVTRAQAGPGWYGCRQKRAQFIEACPTTAADPYGLHRGFTDYLKIVGSNHFKWATIHLDVSTTNDYYTQMAATHEFGHAIGFSHDTDCTSVMTYCRTRIGVRYMWFAQQQVDVYASLYTTHSDA